MNSTEKERSDFGQLIHNNAQRAYNFAFRLAGNDSDARDLVQEAFTRALKHFDRYDPTRPFEAWFNRILKNIFLDGKRRYENKHSVSLDAPSPIEDVSWEHLIPGEEPSPIEELERNETHSLAQKALECLPVIYRTAVLLCDVEGYSYEQIASTMECPVGTVRSRIHQGRVLLKKAFEKLQSGGVEPGAELLGER